MTENLPATAGATPGATALGHPGQGVLITAQGTTTIADGVVAKIAGLAAREIDGVHALGGGAARAVGALRERIPGQRTNVSQGVSVTVVDQLVTVQVDVITEYGVPIADLAAAIRSNVISSIGRMTGLTVTTVDIAVLDVFLSGDSTDDEQ